MVSWKEKKKFFVQSSAVSPKLKLLEDNKDEEYPTEKVSDCTKTRLEARGDQDRNGLSRAGMRKMVTYCLTMKPCS